MHISFVVFTFTVTWSNVIAKKYLDGFCGIRTHHSQPDRCVDYGWAMYSCNVSSGYNSFEVIVVVQSWLSECWLRRSWLSSNPLKSATSTFSSVECCTSGSWATIPLAPLVFSSSSFFFALVRRQWMCNRRVPVRIKLRCNFHRPSAGSLCYARMINRLLVVAGILHMGTHESIDVVCISTLSLTVYYTRISQVF